EITYRKTRPATQIISHYSRLQRLRPSPDLNITIMENIFPYVSDSVFGKEILRELPKSKIDLDTQRLYQTIHAICVLGCKRIHDGNSAFLSNKIGNCRRPVGLNMLFLCFPYLLKFQIYSLLCRIIGRKADKRIFSRIFNGNLFSEF